MIPTIGRIVHFFDRDMEGVGLKVGPYPAIVTDVHSNITVDVDVFGQARYPSDQKQTRAVMMSTAEAGLSSWWEWPPR